MINGSFTALITPFTENGGVDYDGLEKLAAFQAQNHITGILAVGTTGESPTLSWDEHNKVIETVSKITTDRCLCIAGTGSNNTAEALTATAHASHTGVDAVLLVDPYYNGPSSLEIRREYLEPVARAFPETRIIPYIIPGRTGTQLLPEDLAILYQDCPNVCTVKEATGNLKNMKKTRACCGPDFSILSGDDGMTFAMMTDPLIQSAGVISVASNIAPKAVAELVTLLQEGKVAEAATLNQALEPLYQLVVVTTTETTPFGDVTFRARNPLGIKTLMAILGLPSGTCRKPLGKMTEKGIQKVIEAGRTILENTPEILQPVADFFQIDLEERLSSETYRENLYYSDY